MAQNEDQELSLERLRLDVHHDFSFGNRLRLTDGGYGSGYWKEKNSKDEKKVVVRKVKKVECAEWWKTVVDYHLNGSLKHANILKVWGFEEDSHFRYFALEMYGGTLEQFCSGQYTGPMPSDIHVLCQLSRGINFIHSVTRFTPQGNFDGYFAHGNLNPRTIYITHSPVRIKVSEFGLSAINYSGEDVTSPPHPKEMNDIVAFASRTDLPWYFKRG